LHALVFRGLLRGIAAKTGSYGAVQRSSERRDR
jgi:hypothetical protein